MTEKKNAQTMDENERVEQAVNMFEHKDFSTVGLRHRLGYSLRLIFWVLGIKAQQGLKRLMDVVVSMTALIILSPIFLITAILIKLDSPGPIFFKQTRVGKWGRLFGVYKFRSMYLDAEKRKQDLMALNEADGPVFKMRNDPRITRVGRYIRKLSVDELPQLINILQGDMSLVGPRPPLPREVEQYNYHQRKRLDVPAGITGLQQVSGRSDLDFEKWVAYDIEYIEKQSIWFDIKILLKTIPAVLGGKGAY
ncbi:MAG: sugar transferase [Chloroflexi bacterium]|nr:sugar transferase [Chloroflexota bacterium]